MMGKASRPVREWKSGSLRASRQVAFDREQKLGSVLTQATELHPSWLLQDLCNCPLVSQAHSDAQKEKNKKFGD